MSGRRGVVLIVALFCGGPLSCLRQTSLGTLGCLASTDCLPPQSICGPDGRCVAGCTIDPTACAAGSACDPATGDCSGGIIGTSCVDDRGCDPPDIVCRPSTHSCVAGCTLAADCGVDQRCNASTGRCCDPASPDCASIAPPTSGCASDAACASVPNQVCVNGACIASCSAGGSCAAPLHCDPTSGHCVVPSCMFDTDCDATSACSTAGACFVLSHAAPGPCAGGATVFYHCAIEATAPEFAACTAAPGPIGCPYCLDGSCFEPGLCTSTADCRDAATCTRGVCLGNPAACATTVTIADIVAGRFGAGKEVCVHGKVMSVRSGYDGLIELKLDTSPYLYVDVAPMYRAAGLALPDVGDTVRAHGTVRWDAGHYDWELSPVDWIGP